MPKKPVRISDDDLLDKCINDQSTDRPIFLFICCALLTITSPAYIYLSTFTFESFDQYSYSPYMVVFFPLLTLYFLIRSYDVMFKTEYTKRFKGTQQTSQSLAARSLRSTIALSWTVFFVNTIFLALIFFLQLYLFARLDTYYNYMLSFSISSVAVYYLSLKNDESFQRRRVKM